MSGQGAFDDLANRIPVLNRDKRPFDAGVVDELVERVLKVRPDWRGDHVRSHIQAADSMGCPWGWVCGILGLLTARPQVTAAWLDPQNVTGVWVFDRAHEPETGICLNCGCEYKAMRPDGTRYGWANEYCSAACRDAFENVGLDELEER